MIAAFKSDGKTIGELERLNIFGGRDALGLGRAARFLCHLIWRKEPVRDQHWYHDLD
jgi:hypothetical protein